MGQDRIDTLQAQWREESEALDVSPMGIIGRIFLLGRLTTRELEGLLSEHDLTLPEFDVLAVLRRSGEREGLSIKRLREFVILSSGAMTNRIDRLEAKGLVRRLPDATDRRGVLVQLTEAGLGRVDALLPDRLAQAAEQVSCLSSQEQELLTGLLRRLVVSLDPERQAVPYG